MNLYNLTTKPDKYMIPGMREPVSWDCLFMSLACDMALKSKDASTQCGAVLVGADKHILSCGYNGPPSEIVDECVPWTQRPEKYAYIIHAEENALWDAIGSYGFDKVKEATLYCTHAPCADCVLRCIKLRIKEVVLRKNTPEYPLSKYQVKTEEIIDKQTYPKLSVRYV